MASNWDAAEPDTLIMTTTSITSVGIIGIGEIGRPAARHLSDGGFDVMVYDVDPDAVSEFRETDVSIADSPAAAAETDLTMIAVGTYPQVQAVVTGEDGILSGASPGHVVAIVSTISPSQSIEIAEAAGEHDVEVVDVPVCRGEQAARDAELLVLGGGDAEVFELVRPAFEQLAEPEDVVHLGPVGSGQVAKAANNMLLWANVVADYEVLSLAKAWGLNLELLRETLTRSSGDNWPLREWDWQYTTWAHKDMDIVLEMAAEKGVTVPLAGLLSQRIREVDEETLDEVR